MAWWASDAKIDKLCEFRGLENISSATEAGFNTIALSGHFSGVELTARALYQHVPKLAVLYRQQKNPLINQLILRGRQRAVDKLVPKDDIRQLLRVIKDGYLVWYASDQSFRGKNSELIPFFNEPAMTNTALNQIARISTAKVIPYFQRRKADGNGYEIDILPALENFPTDDPTADALRVHKLLEDYIRKAPAEYYWVHRRFKGRPEEFPDPYSP